MTTTESHFFVLFLAVLDFFEKKNKKKNKHWEYTLLNPRFYMDNFSYILEGMYSFATTGIEPKNQKATGPLAASS